MKIEYSRCPLCNSEHFVPHKKADATKHPLYRTELPPVLEWVRCETCSHVFTRAHWTDETWQLIFAKSHSNQEVNLGDIGTYRNISARIVDRVLSWRTWPLVPKPSWLDVGCGNGSLLFTAEEFGFSTHGLDLRKSTVDLINGLGYSASCQEVVGYSDSRRFNVVSMADLLEHTAFPKDTLAAAKRALKANGILFISCPNIETAVWKMLGDDNPYWWEIEHFHNFSRERLAVLLGECGFDVLHYGVSERYLSGMEMICVARS